MMQWVPYLSTPAGGCLTYDNWSEIGITTLAYDISELLMKPGIDYLLTLSSIRDFIAWPGDLILDMRSLVRNAADEFRIKSHYDGSVCHLTEMMLWALLDRLSPAMVILPHNMLFSATDFQQSVSKVLQVFEVLEDGQLCATDTEPHHIYYLSDMPAAEGFSGRVCQFEANQGVTRVSILSDEYAHLFEPIDTGCDCPTCQQKLTWGYLHHLYQSTPLLCQRYLIMHNVYTMQQSMAQRYERL